MSKNPNESLTPLEEHLQAALQALDNQIAREMQRDGKQRDAKGVQKWEPYQKRVENLCGFLLEQLGSQQVDLDSLLVLTQATSKALRMLIEDLGSEGLGKVRSAYCISAAQNIEDDASGARKLLTSETLLS